MKMPRRTALAVATLLLLGGAAAPAGAHRWHPPLVVTITQHCTDSDTGRIWLGYAISRNGEWVEDKGYVNSVEVLDFSGRSVDPRTGKPSVTALPSHSGGEGHLFMDPQDYAGWHFLSARVVYQDGHKTVRSNWETTVPECSFG